VEKAKKIAAEMMEIAAQDIAFVGSRFSLPGTNIEPMPFAKVARMAYVGHVLPKGIEPGLDETLFYDPTGMGAPSGVHIAYVEVDPETGMVEILDYVAVDDSGTIINPLLAEGQAHGGVVQGIGQALMEKTHYDDQGQPLAASYMDYALPRASDSPEVTVVNHPVPATTNVLGVKGCGEAGCAGALPSVMNAVVDALRPYGIHHIDMPATPERVWRAIHDAGSRDSIRK